MAWELLEQEPELDYVCIQWPTYDDPLLINFCYCINIDPSDMVIQVLEMLF